VERSKVSLRVDLIYDYCRRGEKVKKETDGNIVRKETVGEIYRNYGIWILTRDGCLDFG